MSSKSAKNRLVPQGAADKKFKGTEQDTGVPAPAHIAEVAKVPERKRR